jgi:rod shape-determining protein MreC
MIKLLKFLTSRSSFLLFVFLELIAIILIIKSHDYAQIRTHSLQTAVSGIINNKLSVIEQHLNLKKHNEELVQQNSMLLKQINRQSRQLNTPTIYNQFDIIPAYAVNNQYNLTHNSLIINKGREDGVMPEMGILGVNGIVGITQKTSKNYSKVVSILNKSTKINIALKHTNYTGFLQWNGKNPNEFSITDMPVNTPLKIGDTIVTSGESSVFPKGIAIGTITNFEMVTGRKSYLINIKTFMDMTNIGPVYIVKNNYKHQIDSLSGNEK